MLTREAVEALAAFDGQGAPVLSVYLDLDPARQVRRSYRIVDSRISSRTRRRDGRTPSPRRCGPRPTASRPGWRASRRAAPGSRSSRARRAGSGRSTRSRSACADHLAFEPAPDVALLLALLDEYERYAVALVDKGRARLFSVFLGEIEEHATFQEELLPPKTARGGLAQSHYQRHHELHAHWHLKRVAERLAELHRRRPFERLILAGPEEATSTLRGLLPRALAHQLVAVIPAETTAGDAEILRMTLDVERRIEREMEERLFGRLLDRAGPGGRATLGLVPTLDALWADIVQTLVVADGAHRPGRECPNCARLEPGEGAACPACGTAMRPLHDVVHRAMSRTLHQAGAVEVVHGRVARDLQERGEGLGALLRYPSPMVAARTG